MNLRLIRTSDYFQRFELLIRYKPGNHYLVPDALSKLSNSIILYFTEGELDVLYIYCFTASLINISP